VGDDVNPCSRTAPCKTFPGAISKTAAGGEIDVLDPGGFGGVTITKSITIDGKGGFVAGVLVSGTNAVIINAAATDTVYLRGLDFEGLGTGLSAIRILSAGQVIIEDCRIEGFVTAGIEVANSTNPVEVVIRNSTVINSGGASNAGIWVHPGGTTTAAVLVEGTLVDNNRNGIRVEDRGKMTVRESVITNSLNLGLTTRATAAAAEMLVDGCTITNSVSTGIRPVGPSTSIIRLTKSTVTMNATGLSTDAVGQIISLGNNTIRGNTVDGAPTSTVGLQ
jgi:hypothetical protein